MPDTLFTFEMLSTLSAASFLTFLIVANTKEFIPKKIRTDLYAVI